MTGTQALILLEGITQVSRVDEIPVFSLHCSVVSLHLGLVRYGEG